MEDGGLEVRSEEGGADGYVLRRSLIPLSSALPRSSVRTPSSSDGAEVARGELGKPRQRTQRARVRWRPSRAVGCDWTSASVVGTAQTVRRAQQPEAYEHQGARLGNRRPTPARPPAVPRIRAWGRNSSKYGWLAIIRRSACSSSGPGCTGAMSGSSKNMTGVTGRRTLAKSPP